VAWNPRPRNDPEERLSTIQLEVPGDRPPSAESAGDARWPNEHAPATFVASRQVSDGGCRLGIAGAGSELPAIAEERDRPQTLGGEHTIQPPDASAVVARGADQVLQVEALVALGCQQR
jgi:hypothetical protein